MILGRICDRCGRPGGFATGTCPLAGWEGPPPDIYLDHLVDCLQAALARKITENDMLRVIAARIECPYGKRAPEGHCRSGYPGCACADDTMVFETERVRALIVENRDLREKLSRVIPK